MILRVCLVRADRWMLSMLNGLIVQPVTLIVQRGRRVTQLLALQCITDFNRRILGVYGPQFGTKNDKDIVKTDPNVKKIRNGWFKDIWWQYYDADGSVKTERGMYLICDNAYLRWPQSMCPYVGEPISTVEGYFLFNLESARKDVKCTFGILKKCWKILNNGLMYRYIKVCNSIFVTCC